MFFVINCRDDPYLNDVEEDEEVDSVYIEEFHGNSVVNIDRIPEPEEFCKCNKCRKMETKVECKCCSANEFLSKSPGGNFLLNLCEFKNTY